MLRVNDLGSALKFSALILFFSSSFLLTSCSSDDKKSDTPEGAYAIAQEFEKDERYEEAIRRFQEVKNKFPYSKYATMAELSLADVYYKQESFPEAQVAYQAFKDLHPKHAQTDYVTYRLGMSYFMQLPPTIDRDLTLAQSAILHFDDLEKQFPQSTYLKEAKEKRAEAVKMQAEKEQYIADFYFRKELFDSAMARYEGLVRQFPGLGYDAKALSRVSICAAKLGDMEKARKTLAELKNKFPNTPEASEAAEVIK